MVVVMVCAFVNCEWVGCVVCDRGQSNLANWPPTILNLELGHRLTLLPDDQDGEDDEEDYYDEHILRRSQSTISWPLLFSSSNLSKCFHLLPPHPQKYLIVWYFKRNNWFLQSAGWKRKKCLRPPNRCFLCTYVHSFDALHQCRRRYIAFKAPCILFQQWGTRIVHSAWCIVQIKKGASDARLSRVCTNRPPNPHSLLLHPQQCRRFHCIPEERGTGCVVGWLVDKMVEKKRERSARIQKAGTPPWPQRYNLIKSQHETPESQFCIYCHRNMPVSHTYSTDKWIQFVNHCPISNYCLWSLTLDLVRPLWELSVSPVVRMLITTRNHQCQGPQASH